MTAYKELIAAGFNRAFVGVLDSAGYLVGTTKTAPAAGAPAGSGMIHLVGFQTAALTLNEPERVNIPGDDGSLGQFEFESLEYPGFVMEFGQRNLTFEALCQGTAVHEAGDTNYVAMQPRGRTRPDLCMILQRKSKSRETGTIGTSMFEGVVLSKVTVLPLGSSNFQGRAAAVYRYAVTVNPFDRFPWGEAFGPTNVDADDAGFLSFSSLNPLVFHRWTGNATEDAFTLTYTPAAESADKVRVFVDGVLQVYTTAYVVDAETKTVTFQAGHLPAENARIIAHENFAA